MNEAVEIAKLPLEQQHPHFQRWRRKCGGVDKVGDGLTLDTGWKEDLYLNGHVSLRCVLVALAAERYRLQHGHWPLVLTDLFPNYLASVPLDPFDAVALRYRRTDTGAIVYSVGKDGRDDGGDVQRDIVFRLWNVEQRRQPAEQPKK
jgi:hypothetical protein